MNGGLMNQIERAERFAALHVKGKPLILYNVWDAGGARAVTEAGAAAVASGSWSIAAAHGYQDGESIPLDFALAILGRIVATTELPVSVDFEGGYAEEPTQVSTNVARVLETGAIGINFEDQLVGKGGIHAIPEQCARIKAIRRRADEAGVPLFINARTDLFLQAGRAEHGTLLAAAKERSHAYAASGASGFFVPGLVDEALIAELCSASTIPVNIMMVDGAPPVARLAASGVSRVSYGPLPYRKLMAELQAGARDAMRY